MPPSNLRAGTPGSKPPLRAGTRAPRRRPRVPSVPERRPLPSNPAREPAPGARAPGRDAPVAHPPQHGGMRPRPPAPALLPVLLLALGAPALLLRGPGESPRPTAPGGTPPAGRGEVAAPPPPRAPPVPAASSAPAAEPGPVPPAVPPGEAAPPPSALATGTVVTPDGLPVAGAFVSLGDLDAGSDTALTGPDGRFAIDALPFYSSLRAVAHLGGTAWRGETPADGGPFEWTIVLQPTLDPAERVVMVEVTDPWGRPVPRAEAVVVAGRTRVPFPDLRCAGVAVAAGRFPVPAARWEEEEVPVFLVRDARDGEGRPLPLGPALLAVDPAGPATVGLRLPTGGILEGRVLLPGGAPAGPVPVSCRLPLPGTALEGGPAPPPPMCRWTDDEGGFAFAAGAEEEGILEVHAPTGLRAVGGPVKASAGGGEIGIRLLPSDPGRGGGEE